MIKSDRFEQIVKRFQVEQKGLVLLSPQSCMKLLRRQHAAVVRLVTRIEEAEQYGDSYHDACARLRTALAAYKRGKP